MTKQEHTIRRNILSKITKRIKNEDSQFNTTIKSLDAKIEYWRTNQNDPLRISEAVYATLMEVRDAIGPLPHYRQDPELKSRNRRS